MNNTEITIFENADFGTIRTATDEASGKVLFCGKDVAEALGYKETAKAIREHCKGVSEMDTPTKGGIQKMKFISEGDLYRLITHSKLPSAEKFERWVFDEVLPTIHKHGVYMTEQTLQKALTSPDFLIQLATQLKDEQTKREQLELTVENQKQIIGELKHRADYTDNILQNKGLVTTTQIAKDYGMSGQKMNQLLNELGVQYKQSGQWLLYSRYHDKGYTHSVTFDFKHKDGRSDVKMETKWTQRGRLFLYGRLKAHGILPVIERTDFDDAET